jgi:hypothetical protein
VSISETIQSIGFMTDLRESALVFPIMLTTHLSCIAVFGGMILMTDLRLLGLCMTGRSVTDVVGQFRVWKRVGFCLMVTMGALLAGSEAAKYSINPFFWAKMTLLVLVGVHALVFRGSVYNNTEEIDRLPAIPTRAKVAASLSLALWFGLVTMGRLIGYYEPPQEKAAVSHQVTVAAHVPR